MTFPFDYEYLYTADQGISMKKIKNTYRELCHNDYSRKITTICVIFSSKYACFLQTTTSCRWYQHNHNIMTLNIQINTEYVFKTFVWGTLNSDCTLKELFKKKQVAECPQIHIFPNKIKIAMTIFLLLIH